MYMVTLQTKEYEVLQRLNGYTGKQFKELVLDKLTDEMKDKVQFELQEFGQTDIYNPDTDLILTIEFGH